MGGHDQVSESQVDANKVEARLQGPVRNQEDRGSKERASDAYSSYSIDTLITSTAKQVLGNCERLVAASLAGTFQPLIFTCVLFILGLSCFAVNLCSTLYLSTVY